MYIAEAEDTPCQRYDPNLWFSKHGSKKTDKAKRLCSLCPERLLCLESTLSYERRKGVHFGTLGGLTADDRSKLLARA